MSSLSFSKAFAINNAIYLFIIVFTNYEAKRISAKQFI